MRSILQKIIELKADENGIDASVINDIISININNDGSDYQDKKRRHKDILNLIDTHISERNGQ
ncbi:hypothetical protein OAU08_02555 [Porticoccaceae bacterium]|nr:hypothetical protein [Porticoccaceae bacterium]